MRRTPAADVDDVGGSKKVATHKFTLRKSSKPARAMWVAGWPQRCHHHHHRRRAPCGLPFSARSSLLINAAHGRAGGETPSTPPLQEPTAIPIKTTTSVRQAELEEQMEEEELHMKRDFSFASL